MKAPTEWSSSSVIKITIGAAASACLVVMGGSWSARGHLSDFNNNLDRRFGAMEKRFERVETAAKMSWSYPMQKEWVDKTVIANPALKLPDPTKIRRDHNAAALDSTPTSDPYASTLDDRTTSGLP